MKKYYIDPYVTYCYPFDVNRHIRNPKEMGVLEQYIRKDYTRDEIDQIICELITKHPYVDGSMYMKINVMWYNEHNTIGSYLMLDVQNDNYEDQQQSDVIVKYEK